MKMASRILAFALVVSMAIGFVPMSAFAAEADDQNTAPETVTVIFDANGGIGEYEAQEVTVGEKVAKPEQDPTCDGSEFAYWTANPEAGEAWDFEENTVEESMTLYAAWTSLEVVVSETEPATAGYAVEHYLETAEGYVLDEAATETLTGVVGEATAAKAKTYEGYTAYPVEQDVIAEDGSTVVKVMYAANPVVVDDDITGKGLESLGMTVVTDEQSTLAPGITLNEMVIFDANGKRVEMYITTADTAVETVKFYANYMDNQCKVWGMQTLSEQVAAMEANYEEPFKIVAGLNASYYNTTSGAPTGAFFMEGVDASTSGDGYAFFAVLKDGTIMIGAKGEYSTYKDQIKEAIGGYHHIVKKGAVASGLDKVTKYPRQTIGITADGKVIVMTADGSQTQTVGLTIQEQAEVMLALGCVEALHLDGGNSATFGTIPEGSDKFVLTNSPSGGAERAVSNTLMIVSTAVADGTFHHAVINAEDDLLVPTASTRFSAVGVDATNGVAEIPENAVWGLADNSMGTLDQDGVFVSNGKLGNVEVQLTVDGNVVGSKTIRVVTPTSISFSSTEATVPYGKTAPLTIIAMLGNNEVKCDADDFDWVINPAEAGTMDGFTFCAAETNLSSATVTASYKHDASVANADITVKFGKGSEVLFDFEDGDISDWHGTDTINEWIAAKNAENPTAKYPIYKPENYSNNIDQQYSSVFLASEENGGHVKSGQYALGFRMDHIDVADIGGWLYNYLYYTGDPLVLRDLANGVNGVRIGMWVYSPDVTNVAWRIVRSTYNNDTNVQGITYKYMKSGYDNANVSYATNYAIPESGWIYVYYDLNDLADNIRQTTSLYDPDKNNNTSVNGNYYPAFLQLFTGSATDTPRDMVFYIDDITLDYSAVTEDRDAPVISNMTVCSDGSNDVALNGQTVDSNLLSFAASIADKSGNANMTGLDYSTAKIYIDGIDKSGSAAFKAGSGMMSLNNVNLTNGKHSIVFQICDKQGNETRMTKYLTVNGPAANSVVSVTGHNDGNNVPEAGSVYYIDVKASDAAQIESVTTTLKLDLTNAFEYEHIVCAEGVTATYSYETLDRELTVTLTHDGSLSGEAILASIPIRVWAWNEAATGITAGNQFASGAIPTIKIEFQATKGQVTYADGAYADYIAGFGGEMVVETKLDNKSAWHKHAPAEISKDAGCTTYGYTGRTYCDGCASVITWGTIIPATGHSYELGENNVLACACGGTFSGVWTDGKTYVDGVLMSDGWVENSFYQDGVMLTGIHKVPAADGSGEFYYDFGQDGICKNKTKYTGLVLEADGKYYYSKLGTLASGWQMIGSDWYYFDTTTLAAASGEVAVGVITYTFEEDGKLTSGVWAPTLYGTRYYYGPGYHKSGWQTIDGKDYCFDEGYRLEGGWQLVLESQQYRNWYFFDENGVCADKNVKPADGVYEDRNGLGGCKNGIGPSGLAEINGQYYYFNHHGYALNNGTYAGRLFKDDYAAYTGFLMKDGAKYYYINGITATNGLYKIDDAYYYIYWGGVVKTNGKYSVGTTFCDLPAGTYLVDGAGKLINGIVGSEGEKILYINGKAASVGLYEFGGSYYYASANGKLKTDGRCYISVSYCDLPAGNYTFGADGKMLDGIYETDGVKYLYINGSTASKGLYEYDGAYYYSYWGGELKTSGRYYISTTYCDLPAGNYSVDENGKVLDGVVNDNGTLILYINGTTASKGLYEVDGAVYYSDWGGVLKVDGKYYVSATYGGNLGAGNYTFGADGKMLDGVVNVNGTLYLYENGSTVTKGLYEVDGAIYFSDWGGVLKVNGKYYVSATYGGDLGAGNYTFGADGKMLNGVAEIDGVKYLYLNGVTATNGLYKIGEDYYISTWGGVLKTSGTYYVGTTYCDLPVGNYTTDENGKLLDGFVTKTDGIYYYVNGNTPAPGLILVDGEYYYVNWGGKLITGQTYYVSKTNGYTIPMNYTFDAQGRLVR